MGTAVPSLSLLDINEIHHHPRLCCDSLDCGQISLNYYRFIAWDSDETIGIIILITTQRIDYHISCLTGKILIAQSRRSNATKLKMQNRKHIRQIFVTFSIHLWHRRKGFTAIMDQLKPAGVSSICIALNVTNFCACQAQSTSSQVYLDKSSGSDHLPWCGNQ